MKIRISKKQGTVLLVTLVITAIFGTALASYMQLDQYQNRAVARSQQWNGAIPLSEAGIEEALAHLNKVGNDNRATNGWVVKDGQYYMARTLDSGRYEVYVNTNWQPMVSSTGYIIDPMTQKEISRTVRASTTKATSLMKGLIAKKGIGMNGGGVKIDSFDSENPTWSTYGRYDPAKSHDMGYAGAVTGNIDTGNGGVWGYVGTGPNGTVNGNVGDAVWMATKPGLEPGHYANDLNLNLPNATAPSSAGAITALPPAATLMVTNYNYLQSQITSTTYPSPAPSGGVTTSIQ